MSGQLSTTLPAHRFIVSSHLQVREEFFLSQLSALGISKNVQLKISDIYFIEGGLPPSAIDKLASLVSDPVIERFEHQSFTQDRVVSRKGLIEVLLRPGVTDTTAQELLKAAHRLGISQIRSVATGTRYEFEGDLSEADYHLIAKALLVNDTIQVYSLGEIVPDFAGVAAPVTPPEALALRSLDQAGLLALSRARRLALDLAEMQAIQAYFQAQAREPSDAELETLAQTWSEHCVHKTFRAEIHFQGAGGTERIDGILNSYLRAATRAIDAPWVRSAFVDNAGVIEFDDKHDISFKVETHNHPSAIEPFGGANTGTGGVVRDILGVSHRPIAATDVLCFGPPDGLEANLPPGVLHPSRVRAGVISGIEDYGNKLGLPTVNGAVLYHTDYTANPLVYCGCVGIGPRGVHPNRPRPGDAIVVIGGKTGRDGLRGATFSSLAMDAQTGEVAGSSVQIGDPITEKGVAEVVVRARDAGLYTAITDCGAGGLSSAVGEMSASLGARVDLARVTLKYAGLQPWEIWLSEAQERMVLAVPPERLEALSGLCERFWVEWSNIGEFEASGRLRVFHGEIPVVDLDNAFLHHGMPRRVLAAVDPKIAASSPAASPPAIASMRTYENLLLALLAHPNLASKEAVIRRYDHEVRGATLVKPLVGVNDDGPSDAVVIKPLETDGWRGFVLSNGINPFIGEIDAYQMAFSVVDEAIRNAVAVGADPARLALLDNFCWGDPLRPETLGSMVQAARGCHDAALYYRAPFISGKDSLNNEFLGNNGRRHAIPGTLLISAIAIHPDVRCAVTMEAKAAGNLVYLLGPWQPGLAGGHAMLAGGGALFASSPVLDRTPVRPENAPELYRRLHAAILSGWLQAAHDLSEGGLATCAAEMCIAGRLGMHLDVSALDPDPGLAMFAETNACFLIEVSPENARQLEAHFGGLPLVKLGRVEARGGLRIYAQDRPVLDVGLDDCVRAFTGARREAVYE